MISGVTERCGSSTDKWKIVINGLLEQAGFSSGARNVICYNIDVQVCKQTDQVIDSYECQDASYNDIHSVTDEP